MLYAKIMLDYANYAHPENLPSTVRYGCRRYGQGWWPQTRRKKGVKKGTYRASSGERTRTRHLRAKTVRTLKLCFYAFMLGVCHYAFFLCERNRAKPKTDAEGDPHPCTRHSKSRLWWRGV